MKSIILARVSTEEQKEAGNSLPAQQARLQAYIQRNQNLQLEREFIFDETAYKEHRAEFEKIIKYVNSFKEVIAFCCDKVDRLSRDFLVGLPELEKLRRQGKIELHFPSDNLVLHKDSPATDLFHFNIAVSLAQYYSNAISDNVKRANEQKIRNGEWPARAPVGYLNTRDEVTGKASVIVDPVRSHLVRRGFELYAQGTYSMAKVAEILKNEGLTNSLPPHRPMNVNQIYIMLKHPFYIGQMDIKGQLHPHKYDTFIDKWLWDKCQEVRANWHKKPFKYASKPYVFRGLIKCDKCGRTITSDTKVKKSGKTYTYLCCAGIGQCGSQRVNEKILLDQVGEAFKILSKMPENVLEDISKTLQNNAESERAFHTKAIDSLRQEYDQLQKRFSVLLDLRLDKSITEEEYTKKAYEMKQRQYEIDDQLKQYTKADEEFAISVSYLLNISMKAYDLYQSSNVEEKRQLIGFMLSNLRLKGNKLLWDYKKPFDALAFANTHSIWFRDLDSNQD